MCPRSCMLQVVRSQMKPRQAIIGGGGFVISTLQLPQCNTSVPGFTMQQPTGRGEACIPMWKALQRHVKLKERGGGRSCRVICMIKQKSAINLKASHAHLCIHRHRNHIFTKALKYTPIVTEVTPGLGRCLGMGWRVPLGFFSFFFLYFFV